MVRNTERSHSATLLMWDLRITVLESQLNLTWHPFQWLVCLTKWDWRFLQLQGECFAVANQTFVAVAELLIENIINSHEYLWNFCLTGTQLSYLNWSRLRIGSFTETVLLHFREWAQHPLERPTLCLHTSKEGGDCFAYNCILYGLMCTHIKYWSSMILEKMY